MQLLTHLYNRFPVYVQSHVFSWSHFDRPVGHRHIKDILLLLQGTGTSNVSTIRCAYIGNQRLKYTRKYIGLIYVTNNKRHSPCVPSEFRNGHFKLRGDPLHCSREICARVEASSIGKKSCRPQDTFGRRRHRHCPPRSNRHVQSQNR